MATAYIVAATPSSPNEKRIANLKSAKTEADARAKLDRVDVEVRTVATGKLTYTAKGAPAVEAPATPAEFEDDIIDTADGPIAMAELREEDSDPAIDAMAEAQAAAAEERGELEPVIDMSGFEAALAEVVSEGPEDAQEDAQEDSAEDGDTPAEDAAPADQEDGQEDAEGDAPAEGDHRGVAPCGCSVEKIIATGEHQKGCANAPKAAAAAKAVERDKPARPARKTGGGARRPAQGPSVVDGWDLLYDKPRQNAQVGRNAEGKYALICTTHKHAHPLTRLTQERGLRGGQRSVWCPQCTGK